MLAESTPTSSPVPAGRRLLLRPLRGAVRAVGAPLRAARGLLSRDLLLDDQLALALFDVAADLLVRRPLSRLSHRLL